MTELVVSPALFILPAISTFGWLVTKNKTALSLAGMSMAAAVVLTMMASNPVMVTDSVTKMWHQCQSELHGGSKTCRIQFGAVPPKP